MQGQLPNRKRPAPGASPIQSNTNAQMFGNNGNAFGGFPNDPTGLQSGDGLMDWSNMGDLNGGAGAFADSANFDPNFYANALGATQAQPTSNQLVKRNINNQLSARNKAAGAGSDLWPDFGDTGQVGDWNNSAATVAEDGEDDLERRAMEAKKEAQAKRKQIPPFVQKLSRYVEPGMLAVEAS